MKRLQGKTITEREAYLIELATLDERDRIIAVIRDWFEADADLIDGPSNLIDLIENGDN